jgi:hypothetical protein
VFSDIEGEGTGVWMEHGTIPFHPRSSAAN